MSDSLLDQMFPPLSAPTPRNISREGHFARHPEDAGHPAGRENEERISTRWATICTLELQGRTHVQIAQALGMSSQGVSHATRDERYRRYRDERLSALDDEFFSMKPLALEALKGGLTSHDENTALRASEQWFKAASFGGYSKTEPPSTHLTAEDVARQLLGVQVNVTVNTTSSAEGGGGFSASLDSASLDATPAVDEPLE